MYTQTEIRSHSNRMHVYAPKGAKVTILSTSLDGVCTVEYNGYRFSCSLSKLGDMPPANDIILTDTDFNLL